MGDKARDDQLRSRQDPRTQSADLFGRASLGLIPVNVYCVEPGDDSGDATGVSFTAFVNFIPRAGDRIILEDDTTCEVKRIYYKVAKTLEVH